LIINNQNPAVSIIIPTLNEADRIGAFLQELQTFSLVEIIVSDGGSTDRTLEICSAYPVTVCTGSAGRGKQLNRGVQAARSKILLFLHADTHMPRELIPQIIEAVRIGRMWGCAHLAFDDSSVFSNGWPLLLI
jgi:glycosyltransferase involved in cell wall biosynthesis